MLSLDDPRWGSLQGGYRVPFDPRPLLARIEADDDSEAAWRPSGTSSITKEMFTDDELLELEEQAFGKRA